MSILFVVPVIEPQVVGCEAVLYPFGLVNEKVKLRFPVFLMTAFPP